MRSLNPLRCQYVAAPTVYADALLARAIAAVERRAANVEVALARYAQARRAAGVRPEQMLVEFKRLLPRVRSSASAEGPRAERLTHRLIELYFAA